MKWNLGRTAFTLTAFVLGSQIAAPNAGAQEHPKEHPSMAMAKAVAVLHATQGNTAQGVVTFTQEQGGVRVVAKLTGVPKGVHGFHIHEFGDCSSADGTSAGGHFNPTGMSHAGPTAEKRHVGDLGNVTADEQGNVALDYVDKHLAFSGANAIIGHAVILHANPDDFTTQPTGNAGGRIACGVIGVAKP
jgi:Cu-Zn family superoxide dismutase